MRKKLLFLTLLFFSLTLSAADIFVDQSAPTGGDGSSWATAFQDIQSAIDIAVADDTIYIAAGIYRPEDTIEITVPLNFRGGYPAGGGVQNIDAHITQIQADFDPGNLILRIFDIDPNAAASFTGLRFFNCRQVIVTASNLSINQLQFEQCLNAIFLAGTIDFCTIENSSFTDFTSDMIAGPSVVMQNFGIQNSILENSTGRAIFLGDDVANFSMIDCIIRDFNNSASTVSLDETNATITNLLVEDNVSTAGAIIFFRDTDLTLANATFNNNTGEGTICLQGSTSELNLIDSNFTNNRSVSVFPKPVMGMRDVVITATHCLFENNYAEGSQPDAVGEIRGDTSGALITFEQCEFINNTAIGSITCLLYTSPSPRD